MKEEKSMAQKKETNKKETHVKVLVEMRVPRGKSPSAMLSMGTQMRSAGFVMDTKYEPVSMEPEQYPGLKSAAKTEDIVVVRGTVEKSKIKELEAHPNVVKVWTDARIEPFGYTPWDAGSGKGSKGICPISPCDCKYNVAKGDFTSVAAYLGVDKIWAKGYKGKGIVVGVVDGGITAEGRPTNAADTGSSGWPDKLVPNVIDGWPAADWGTTGVAWDWHGNMTSSDVLGMAPEAKIYDLRISDAEDVAGTLSDALQAFQWAINKHKENGTPQILSNSWGMYRKNWAVDYATKPDHPFTKKVIEAINEGIIVLFAAGNCGQTCPSGQCETDNGPGKSIWGANGHPKVMTVGAVNQKEEWVGYSSQGPAALDPDKPDFCSITHFKGYTACDNGTSAATPIASGVVALLKQCKPTLTQDAAKASLKSTAKDIGGAGWDQHSGAGIIQAKKAFDKICPSIVKPCTKSGPYSIVCVKGGPGTITCASNGPDQIISLKCPGPFLDMCKAGPDIIVGCGGGADFQVLDPDKFKIDPERWIMIRQDNKYTITKIPKTMQKSFVSMLEKMMKEQK
jgi:serine protease AprX